MFDADRFNELRQIILKASQPSARMTALLEIRQYDDPRVDDLLRHVSEYEKNREVRDLAKNLYTKRQLRGGEGFASPVEPESGDNWSCSACGGVNSGGRFCRFCGVARPAPTRSQPLLGENDLNLNLSAVEGQAVHIKPKHIVGGVTTCGLVFILPFILIGAVIGLLAFNETNANQALEDHGINVTGMITDKYIFNGEDNSDTRYVKYRFTYNDKTYTGQQSVNWDVYDEIEKGDAAPIRFLPEDPTVSEIHSGNPGPLDFLPGPITIFAVVWNAIVCLAVAILLLTGLGIGRLLRRAAQ